MSLSNSSHEPDVSQVPGAVDPDRELADFSRALSPISPRFFALLSIVAVLFARGVAPALPGTRAGIDLWITRLETGSTRVPSLAAWLTQLTLVSGIWLCTLLLQRALSQRGVPSLFHLLAVIVTPALLALGAFLNVTGGQLGGLWLLAVAAACALLAGASSILALRWQPSRAAGLVLILITLSGCINVVARVLALRASEQARSFDFTIAQALASASFTIDAVATLVALGWFLAKPTKGRLISTSLLFLGTIFMVFAAIKGSFDGSWWQVLVARTFDELTTHPDPLLPLPIRNFFELLSFGAALCVLFKPKTLALAGAAIALALTSRGNLDMPLSAVMLACSALLSALPAAMQRTPRPSEAQARPGSS